MTSIPKERLKRIRCFNEGEVFLVDFLFDVFQSRDPVITDLRTGSYQIQCFALVADNQRKTAGRLHAVHCTEKSL